MERLIEPNGKQSPAKLQPLGEIKSTHSLVGDGLGGANSDEGTDTLVLSVQYNPSTTGYHHVIPTVGDLMSPNC